MRWMGVDAGVDTHGFHHGNVRLHLAGRGADARFLASFHVNQADVLHLHESLGAQSGGTQHEVLRHTHGDVAAVSVHIFAVPQAAAHVAHAFLDHQDFRGIEKRVHFLLRDGIVLFPREYLVREGRGD